MIQNVMEIRWTDLQEMGMDKTALFIGIAPVEEHGRHFALGLWSCSNEGGLARSYDR